MLSVIEKGKAAVADLFLNVKASGDEKYLYIYGNNHYAGFK
jgi:hypothetical protein